jgi:hypothetical protein
VREQHFGSVVVGAEGEAVAGGVEQKGKGFEGVLLFFGDG